MSLSPLLIHRYAEVVRDATHTISALKLRAEQLTRWERNSKFAELAIAPGIIVAAANLNNAEVLSISLLISGVLSLAAWARAIGVLTHNLERQLSLSKSISIGAANVLGQLKKEWGLLDSSRELTDQESQRLEDLFDRIRVFREEMTNNQVHVQPWMNVKAQQETMNIERADCRSCQRPWHEKQELTKREIKKRLREIKKSSNGCSVCCQL